MMAPAVPPIGRGAVRRRPRPSTVDGQETWLYDRLTNEVGLQHSLYLEAYGPLCSGPLKGSAGRPIHARVGILTDRYLASSLSRICKDFVIFSDYDFDADASTPPTAVIMNRVGEVETIPLSWTKNRVRIGGKTINLSAQDAGEALVDALVRPVSDFFLGC